MWRTDHAGHYVNVRIANHVVGAGLKHQCRLSVTSIRPPTGFCVGFTTTEILDIEQPDEIAIGE